MTHIYNEKLEHIISLNYDYDNFKKNPSLYYSDWQTSYYASPTKYEYPIIDTDDVIREMTREEKIKASDTDAISVTGQIMTDSVNENTAILENQLKKDGWCADLYEGLKWCVGSDNLDENVKADIAEFNSYCLLVEKTG